MAEGDAAWLGGGRRDDEIVERIGHLQECVDHMILVMSQAIPARDDAVCMSEGGGERVCVCVYVCVCVRACVHMYISYTYIHINPGVGGCTRVARRGRGL